MKPTRYFVSVSTSEAWKWSVGKSVQVRSTSGTWRKSEYTLARLLQVVASGRAKEVPASEFVCPSTRRLIPLSCL